MPAMAETRMYETLTARMILDALRMRVSYGIAVRKVPGRGLPAIAPGEALAASGTPLSS
jgi:hypothetical protein